MYSSIFKIFSQECIKFSVSEKNGNRESCRSHRRDRQNGARLPGGPLGGPSRTVGPRTERQFPGPLHRRARGSVQGALHLHGQRAGHHSRAPQGQDGDDRRVGVRGRGKNGDRQELPHPSGQQGVGHRGVKGEGRTGAGYLGRA